MRTRRAERAGGALGRVRFRRRLPPDVYRIFFNQSGEILVNGRERGAIARNKDTEESSSRFKKAYIATPRRPTNSPNRVEAISEHFDRVNAAIRTVERKRLEAEPRQVDALLAFAERAYRRPLTRAERDDLRGFYRSLREKSSLTHEDAMRDLIVNVLMSPHFSYRVDAVGVARRTVPASPLPDHALASRLSYFLWSSMPDAELPRKRLRRARNELASCPGPPYASHYRARRFATSSAGTVRLSSLRLAQLRRRERFRSSQGFATRCPGAIRLIADVFRNDEGAIGDANTS